MTPMTVMLRPIFLARVENANPGETIVYHIGSIMRDRATGAHFPEVHSTACAAWEMMEAGKVVLLQRRIEPGLYEYRAKKLAPPFVPVEWFGPYAAEKQHQKPRMVAHV